MKTYRYYGKGFRWFRLIGSAFLLVAMFWFCYAVTPIILRASIDYIFQQEAIEEAGRQQRLVEKGFISQMPELSKKHKLRDCVIRDEKMVCEKFVNGERVFMEVTR